MKKKTKAIVLAAGKGTRMKSDLAKVLHIVAGKTIIEWIVFSLKQVEIDEIILIVSKENKKEIQQKLKDTCTYIIQEEQLGTAHAVLQAESYLKDFYGNTIVMVGDAPGISERQLELLQESMLSGRYAGVFLSVICEEHKPPWGRVLYKDNQPYRIVEEKDASAEEKKIREVSSSHFIFNNQKLFTALHRISDNNVQREYYLSDIIEVLSESNLLKTILVDDIREVYGINTPEEQKMVEEYMSKKRIKL